MKITNENLEPIEQSKEDFYTHPQIEHKLKEETFGGNLFNIKIIIQNLKILQMIIYLSMQ